jgi:hypothetical protein
MTTYGIIFIIIMMMRMVDAMPLTIVVKKMIAFWGGGIVSWELGEFRIRKYFKA